MAKHPTIGRLVIILEPELHPLSRGALRAQLAQWYNRHRLNPEPTFLASLAKPSRVAALQADDYKLIYSTLDDLNWEETMTLLPWREVWLLAHGQFWQGMPQA